MAKRLVVQVNGDVYWKVNRDDPLWVPLSPAMPASLLCPLATAATWPWTVHPSQVPWQMDSGEILFHNAGFVLDCDDHFDDSGFESLGASLAALLASLRHLSGQFRLPSVVNLVSVATVEQTPVARDWPATTEVNGYVRGDLVRYAIPFAIVPEAVAMTVKGGPPIFSMFFLDALEAHATSNWRMALLLAAIALETGVAEALSEWRDRRLAELPRPPGVVELPGSGGGSVVKDPVYDALSQKVSIKYLLHERPLHLAQRSLLVEDGEVYRRSRKLYATRNKIAHLGGPDSANENCYGLNRGEVEEALRATKECLAFFGKSVTEPFDFSAAVEARGCVLASSE